MKQVRWVIINGFFACLMYAGFVLEIEGAKNVVMLFAWATIIISFFYMSDSAIKEIRKRGRTVPPYVGVIYDLGVAATFAWFGAWVTGAFWILQLILQEGAYAKADELNEAEALQNL